MEILNFAQISLQDMLLICEISARGSVSQAANVVRISQPTASYRLNKMRQLFDDPLFQSVNRVMRPTVKGHRVVATFEKQIEIFRMMELPEIFDPSQTRREFKILAEGFQISAMCKLLPNEFFAKTKFAKLLIEPAQSNIPVNQQLQDSADFFVAPFSEAGAKGIRRLVSPALKVVIYYDAKIRKPPSNLKEYAASRFVLLSNPMTAHKIFHKAEKSGQMQRNIVSYSQTPETMARFVEGTDLIFIGTAFISEQTDYGLSIADFPFDMPDIRHEIRWSISKEDDPGHQWLKNLIVEAAYFDVAGCNQRDPAEKFVTLSEFEELPDQA